MTELVGRLIDDMAYPAPISDHDSATPGQLGWMRISDGQIESVGRGEARFTHALPAATDWLFPGFVDVHCHGGGGAEFASEDGDEIRAAAMFHLRHGTTSILASLPAAPVDVLCRQAAAVARVIADGDTTIRGIHFEGPFLSPRRCGAQNPKHLIAPDPGVLRRLVDAGGGTTAMVTIAPELAGAIDIVLLARELGIHVALGHSDATYEEASRAFDAGATIATHLFNGMRPTHHREPGIATAALEHGAGLELIGDGVHLHPATVRSVDRSARGRWMLITDAIAAAGAPTGRYSVGDQVVTVSNGVARVATSATAIGSLAGSTLTMDAALRHTVLRFGIPLDVAVWAATSVPAKYLGLGSIAGRLASGRTADLVRMTGDLSVSGVMAGGRWLS